MTYPRDLRYTKDHEWIKAEDSRGRIGLTNYAQDQLGDIVFVELPEVGRELERGEVFGVVESVKAVSDCYSPASGKVVEVNEKLLDEPELINKDPHGEGWMTVIELSDPAELDQLMDAEAYEKHLEEQMQ